MWTENIVKAQEAEDKRPVDVTALELAVEEMRQNPAFTESEIAPCDKVAKEAILGKKSFTVGQLREVSPDLADNYLQQIEQNA